MSLELLSDWNKDLCAAYERAQRKWGDPWKLALVNPIVKSTIASLGENNAKPLDVDVYKALLSPAEVFPARKQLTSKDLESWYAPKRRLHSSRRRHLSILDLGCGPARLRAFVTRLGHEYIGIDSAPTYVHGSIHSVDLDAPNVRADLEQVLAQPSVRVVLLENLLEHLTSPHFLLSCLANQLGRRETDVPIVCSVVAPEYHRRRSDPDLSRRESVEIFSLESSRSVAVTLRSYLGLMTLFRDAGFLVRCCQPLSFGAIHQPPAQEPVDSRGLPPFWLAVLSPRRKLVSRGPEALAACHAVTRTSPESHMLFERLNTIAADGSPGIDLSLFEVPPGTEILRQHNLGGDLFVLVRGEAHLVEQSAPADGPTRMITFTSGDFFGELETANEISACTFYPFSVIAGEDTCLVLRVGASTVGSLLSQTNRELGGNLYRVLRDRLKRQMWFYRTLQVKGPLKKSGKGMAAYSKRALQALASALLWAAEAEYLYDRRLTGCDAAFVDLRSLAQRFMPTADPDAAARDAFGRLLALLVRIGICDAAPIGSLLARQKFREPIRTALASLLTFPAWPAPILSVAGGWLGTRVDLQRRLVGKNRKETKAAAELRRELELLWKSLKCTLSLDSLWSRLTTLDKLVSEETPSFVLIRDPQALRLLALGSNAEIESLIDDRVRYHGLSWEENQSWFRIVSYYHEEAFGRFTYYCLSLQKFLESDLRLGGGCACSGLRAERVSTRGPLNAAT